MTAYQTGARVLVDRDNGRPMTALHPGTIIGPPDHGKYPVRLDTGPTVRAYPEDMRPEIRP